MLHARKDYQRIQDPENKIPGEEPVFLLRASDLNAPLVVAYWADVAESNGADQTIIKSARMHAAQMLAWQARHGKKIPDMP